MSTPEIFGLVLLRGCVTNTCAILLEKLDFCYACVDERLEQMLLSLPT